MKEEKMMNILFKAIIVLGIVCISLSIADLVLATIELLK